MKIIDGKPEFKGATDVILKVVKYEGVTALWKGFTPYYFRLGPHTVLTFIFLEQMNKWYKVLVLGQTNAKGGGNSKNAPNKPDPYTNITIGHYVLGK